MPYTITYDPMPEFINVTLSEDINGNELSEVTTECISLQKDTRVLRFLVEANEWEVVASFFDLYKIVYEQYTAEGFHHLSRIAVVLATPLNDQADTIFYETVCQSAGWNARVFSSLENAIDWVMSSADINDAVSDQDIFTI